MKTRISCFLLLYFVVLGCKTTQPTMTEEIKHGWVVVNTTPRDGPSAIMGTVRDLASNEAIPFAEITLTGRDGKTMGVRSDMDGNFSMNGVFMMDFRLMIRSQDYETIDQLLEIGTPSTIRLDVRLKRFVMQVEKPIIYLYPERSQKITVALDYAGELTHAYPAYPRDGWVVTAGPDGVLHDEKGQEYYALFWEGVPQHPIVPRDGFIVPGRQTAAFLEDKLAYLGLNRREANEFILYWLPRMENNPFNLIHFSGKEYDEMARLNVTPKPETVIRVMMLTQPLSQRIDFPLQDLSAMQKKRNGFTLVEWGGSVVESVIQSQ